MGSFERGIKEAMVGVIGGIVVAAIMKSLSADGLLPSYFVWLFIIVGIAGNIALSEHLYSHIVKRYDVNPVNIPYITAKEYLFLACQTQYYAGLDWCNNV